MRRFVKETIFQQQLPLFETVDHQAYLVDVQDDREEDPEKHHVIQRLHNKHFL